MRDLARQSITGRIKIVDDGSKIAAVAKHIAEQHTYSGRATLVYPTTAEQQAEMTLAAMLLSKKPQIRKSILGNVKEEEILHYAKICKLSGKATKTKNETSFLLEKIKKISPDAVFALAKQHGFSEKNQKKKEIFRIFLMLIYECLRTDSMYAEQVIIWYYPTNSGNDRMHNRTGSIFLPTGKLCRQDKKRTETGRRGNPFCHLLFHTFRSCYATHTYAAR